MKKHIVILNGSPRLNGNTVELIRKFAKGAEESGNIVDQFDLQTLDIRGCLGCLGGGKNTASPCVQKDGMEEIYLAYTKADLIVLASPMYYWSFSGQLKTAIDRLFAVTECDPNYRTPKKDVVLLMSAEGTGDANNAPVLDYYHALCGFLDWKDCGYVIASGVLTVGDIVGHPALKQAYELGKSIQ